MEQANFPKQVYSSMMGYVVADALGVPVEFKSRAVLDLNPVTDMLEYGTYKQPKGTWSDDSSMTLCTLESLCKGVDYNDMMDKFILWAENGYMTAHDEVFDIGVSTRTALSRCNRGTPALQCGGSEFDENGNGSLMRILPLVFYLNRTVGPNFTSKPTSYEIIHNVSRLTHAHPISLISCGIYAAVANELLMGKYVYDAVKDGINIAKKYYRSKIEYAQYLKLFLRVNPDKLMELDRNAIRSTGYVLHTLEASLWCLLQTASFKDCLLKAVNLGDDTDTVAAVAGGLAGLCYDLSSLPEDWLSCIAKKELIRELCTEFCDKYQ